MKKKWNVLDLVILLLVVAVIAVLGLKLFGQGKTDSAQSESVEIVYTASIRDVRIFTANQYHVGDKLFDNNTGAYVGTVTAVEAKPLMEAQTDSDGKVIQVEKAGYYSVDLTISGTGLERENGYFLSNLVEVKCGAMQRVYSKYVRSELQFNDILSVEGVSVE